MKLDLIKDCLLPAAAIAFTCFGKPPPMVSRAEEVRQLSYMSPECHEMREWYRRTFGSLRRVRPSSDIRDLGTISIDDWLGFEAASRCAEAISGGKDVFDICVGDSSDNVEL